MAAPEVEQGEKVELHELIVEKSFPQQGAWFLNAFWQECESLGEETKEQIYQWTQLFILYKQSKGEEFALDEFEAHKLWEKIGQTLTVIAMREKLRTVDLDGDGKMSMFEFLLCNEMFEGNPCFNVHELLTRPQGTNESLIKAMKALDDLKAIEDAANKKKLKLETALAKATEANQTVKMNRAKNELAQHEARDMTPYNRQLITAEAAVRKAQRDADNLTAQGTKWWMSREIEEANKYKAPKRTFRN